MSSTSNARSSWTFYARALRVSIYTWSTITRAWFVPRYTVNNSRYSSLLSWCIRRYPHVSRNDLPEKPKKETGRETCHLSPASKRVHFRYSISLQGTRGERRIEDSSNMPHWDGPSNIGHSSSGIFAAFFRCLGSRHIFSRPTDPPQTHGGVYSFIYERLKRMPAKLLRYSLRSRVFLPSQMSRPGTNWNTCIQLRRNKKSPPTFSRSHFRRYPRLRFPDILVRMWYRIARYYSILRNSTKSNIYIYIYGNNKSSRPFLRRTFRPGHFSGISFIRPRAFLPYRQYILVGLFDFNPDGLNHAVHQPTKFHPAWRIHGESFGKMCLVLLSRKSRKRTLKRTLIRLIPRARRERIILKIAQPPPSPRP